jgi:hypothetical protein
MKYDYDLHKESDRKEFLSDLCGWLVTTKGWKILFDSDEFQSTISSETGYSVFSYDNEIQFQKNGIAGLAISLSPKETLSIHYIQDLNIWIFYPLKNDDTMIFLAPGAT